MVDSGDSTSSADPSSAADSPPSTDSVVGKAADSAPSTGSVVGKAADSAPSPDKAASEAAPEAAAGKRAADISDIPEASAPDAPADVVTDADQHGAVVTDTELVEADPPTDTAHGEKTEHAPLSQFASRVGGRPLPEPGSPVIQEPVDPWPAPIQGLIPPAGAQSFEDLDLLQYTQPGAAPPRNVRLLVTVLVVAVLALVAGGVGVVARSWAGDENHTPDAASPSSAAVFPSIESLRGGAASSSPSPTSSEDDSPVPTGPVPQGVPPKNIYEMDQICSGETYWPMLPKRTSTKNPHPILVYGDLGDGERMPFTMFEAWFLKGKTAEKAWDREPDESPSAIQLVACVDRVSSGAKVRTCKYDSPANGSATLYRATYRLHVYEAATGKKLLDKKMAAQDTSCPQVIKIPDDKKLYMEMTTNTLVPSLRKLVGI